MTVAQFCHQTSKVPADRFFLLDSASGEQKEISYREFKRTVGSFIGKSIVEALVDGVPEDDADSGSSDPGDKLSFQLIGITVMD